MNSLRDILQKLKDNKITINEAEKRIKAVYIEEIEDLACFDIFRELRTGFPEVIYAENKEVDDIIKICERIIEKKGHILVSKLVYDKFKTIDTALKSIFKQDIEITYNKKGKVASFKVKGLELENLNGKIGIITAGTSDIYIAEEAKAMIELMNADVITAYDVGISGLHRIFPPLKNMLENDVDIMIVVAGMEGTLPSVVASLVDVPVIGVPAPTGYGRGEKGLGALTTMLQSCAPGLVVVNIGNGFGAAVTAILFLKRIQKYRIQRED